MLERPGATAGANTMLSAGMSLLLGQQNCVVRSIYHCFVLNSAPRTWRVLANRNNGRTSHNLCHRVSSQGQERENRESPQCSRPLALVVFDHGFAWVSFARLSTFAWSAEASGSCLPSRRSTVVHVVALYSWEPSAENSRMIAESLTMSTPDVAVIVDEASSKLD